MSEQHFPGDVWQRAKAEDANIDASVLEQLAQRLTQVSDNRPYRVLVVRHGLLAAEWQSGIAADVELSLASAAKSVYSSVLGIAVAKGKLPSLQARVVDYYPEMMDVPDGLGPKPGRFAMPENRAITFEQLISNTSGYMKPGEEPGKVFHYQTFGMNLVTHALASIYGLYSSGNPGNTPGFGELIDRYIREPIGGSWRYDYMNFDHAPGARIGIFGNYCAMHISARDMARLGLLWLNEGRWAGEKLVPAGYLARATKVAPPILANCPDSEWKYGYAFWTNSEGVLWPNLPTSAYAAVGAGRQMISVFPDKDLVIVQGPAPYETHHDAICLELLESIHGACH